ncbi:MAG: anti-sigma factor family protein [Gemmataceae bacterium]
MDCDTARRLLDFAGLARSELDASDSGALEQHLRGCLNCRKLADADARFDKAIGPAMINVPIPEGLNLRVMKRLNSDRDKYYRGILYRAGAVATLLVLLIGGSWWWFTSWRTEVQMDQIQDIVRNRDRATATDKKAKVDQWLADQSSGTMTAPSRFNYNFLEKWDVAEIPGTRILAPVLRFRVSEFRYADVYLLSDKHIDFESLNQEMDLDQSIHRGSAQVTTMPSGDERVYYLIIHKGELRDVYNPEIQLR